MINENELTKKYFPFLDGLRGIAILWVILHHLPVYLPNWVEQIRIRGDLGVELFFSISSFLVFRSLHQCILKKDQSRTEFLKRRIFRIFPPYFFILLTIFASSLFDKSLKLKLISIKGIIPSFFLFYYNYAHAYAQGIIPGSLNIFWSLCFEEQFYVALFLTALLFPRRINSFIISGVIFSIFLRVYYFINETSIPSLELQMQTHLRLDAILLGCLFYYYWGKINSFFNFTSFNAILCFLAIFLYNFINSKYQGLLYIVITFSFTCLIFNLLNNDSHKIAIYLQNKYLRKIGVVSFEIYLLHEIFVGIAVRFGLKNQSIYFLLTVYGLSIFSALLMHKFFSNPINSMLRKRYILS